MRALLAIGLLVGALLFGGCGEDDEEPQSGGQQQEQQQEPEQQEGAVEGTGYSFVPPDGWRDASQFFEGSAIKVDTAYAESEAEGGFATNVNVIRETPQGLEADRFDAYVEEFRKQASALATDAGLSAIEELELDGEPARTWDYESRQRPQAQLRQQQVVALHGDGLYTITWSARGDAFEESQADLDRLLDSWRWTSR